MARSLRTTSSTMACNEGRAVYVRGIPPDWSVADLRQFFERWWALESVRLLPKAAGQRTCAGFVNFWTTADATEAVGELDHYKVEGPRGQEFWLSVSLKGAAHTKVEVVRPDFSKPSEVLQDLLFLGNRDNALDLDMLQSLKISHIVSVLCATDGIEAEVAGVAQALGATRLLLDITDTEGENIVVHFSHAFDFLEASRRAGGRILVHCVAGRSRSPSLVLGYLMYQRSMRLDDAYDFLKEKRPCIAPNTTFWEQLRREDRHLFGHPAADWSDARQNQWYTAAKNAPPDHRKDTSAPDDMLVAQLPDGALSWAAADFIESLENDLRCFASLHNVSAEAVIDRDRVVICNISSFQHAEACCRELAEICAFYGCGQIAWSDGHTLYSGGRCR